MDRANVDTDAIIPKQFLKSIKRSGFGPNAFDEWRYLDHGEPGMDNSKLAKVTIYLTDESLIPAFMEGAAGALPSPPPATTLLIVKALAAPTLLVEIEAVAVG